MKSVVTACPDVKPQEVLADQEFSQTDVCQGQVFCDRPYFVVRLTAGRCCKVLLCLIPHLIGVHQLFENPLDGDLHFVIWGLYKATVLRAKCCCAATFSKSIKMPFMLQAGTLRLMFQSILDSSSIKGNLRIISDSRIRSIIAKGFKYRFPVHINFSKVSRKKCSIS